MFYHANNLNQGTSMILYSYWGFSFSICEYKVPLLMGGTQLPATKT